MWTRVWLVLKRLWRVSLRPRFWQFLFATCAVVAIQDLLYEKAFPWPLDVVSVVTAAAMWFVWFRYYCPEHGHLHIPPLRRRWKPPERQIGDQFLEAEIVRSDGTVEPTVVLYRPVVDGAIVVPAKEQILLGPGDRVRLSVPLDLGDDPS